MEVDERSAPQEKELQGAAGVTNEPFANNALITDATEVTASTESSKKEARKYCNAVGGRSLMLSRRDGRVLKAARDREIFFYQLIDRARKDRSHNKHTVATELRRFLPKYYGEEVLVAPVEEDEEDEAAAPQDMKTGATSEPAEKKSNKKKDEGFLVLDSPKTHSPSPGSFGGNDQFPTTPPIAPHPVTDTTSTEQVSPCPAPPDITLGVPVHPPPPSVGLKEPEPKKDEKLRMLMLEDICHKFTRPCVMDLKMGDRQYGLNAKDKKIESKTRKARESTSAELGVRAAGYRRVDPQTNQEVNVDKYVCRVYKVPEFTSCMRQFLLYDPELMEAMLRQVEQIKELFEERQNFFRFYTTSLLMVYDYANPVQTARVVMVDFAFTYTIEEMREAKDLAAFTSTDESYTLGLRSLCRMLKDRPVMSSKPSSSSVAVEGSRGDSPSSSSSPIPNQQRVSTSSHTPQAAPVAADEECDMSTSGK